MKYYIGKKKVSWFGYVCFAMTHFLTHRTLEVQYFDKPRYKVLLTYAEADNLQQLLFRLLNRDERGNKKC